MNFLGFLWVVSAISSFWSPQDTPRFLDYFNKIARSRTVFLAEHAVAGPRQRFYFSAASAVPKGATGLSKSAATSSVSRLWSPALAAFIEPGAISDRDMTIAHLAVQPASRSAFIWAPGELPLSLPQLMGTLFRQPANIRQAFRLSTPLITIVPAENPCAALEQSGIETWSRWTYKSNHGVRALELGECTGLWRNDATLPLPVATVFQVRVKGQVVAEVPTQADAEKIARQLHRVLRQPEFTPQSLLPAIVDGSPMGRAGNTALFWVAPEWAELLDRNRELMAIDWINQLRIALDVPPLSVAEAQSQMHGLVPTAQQISGKASWYGTYFHGRLTATGEIYDQHELTAAHPSLPFNTYLKVTNLLTHQTVIVRINDRGPYFEDRSLDLSQEAARSLGSELKGVVPFNAVLMQKAELAQSQPRIWAASQAVRPQGNWAKRLLSRR